MPVANSQPPGNSFKGRKKEEKSFVIEESVTKPPGATRFTRKKACDKQATTELLSEVALFSEEDICIQLLTSGFVQSYVDFYHLTHRVDPSIGEGMDTGAKILTSLEDMKFIRDNLVQAELSRRKGNTSGVYSAYNKLADLYALWMDWRTSIFFNEKCLEVAQLTNDLRAEMSANHALGCVYEKMADYDASKRFHERHEELAGSVDVLEEVAVANVELYKVYMVLALRLDNDNKYEEALQMYGCCLSSAKKCWNKAAEGEANGKIGSLKLLKGQAEEAIPYLQEQSQIAADMGYAEGRCRACSALALAYDNLNKPERALQELSLVHTISEQAGDALLQAQACKALGTLYSKVGKLEEAVEALQKHFTLLKSILQKANAAATAGGTAGQPDTGEGRAAAATVVTSQDMDLARVYVGITRGNLMMGAYVLTIQGGITPLLDWKLNRSELVKLS